jgi:hypothetical protein
MKSVVVQFRSQFVALCLLGVAAVTHAQQPARSTLVLASWAPGVMPLFIDDKDGGTVRLGVERATRLAPLTLGVDGESSRFSTRQVSPTGHTNAERQRNFVLSAVARLNVDFKAAEGRDRLYFMGGLSYNALRFSTMSRAPSDSADVWTTRKTKGFLPMIGVGFSLRIARMHPFMELAYSPVSRFSEFYPVGVSLASFGIKF